ncbi:MAG: tetratricopeptide repeat protein, partial [Psychrobacter sp.]
SQDYDQAMAWYLKAANQGDAGAQNNIGDIYEKGAGVSKDDVKAAQWYLKAANQGDALAQNSLGLMYFEGRGVKQDKIKSQEWYSKSCDNGYQPSCDAYKIPNKDGN